MFLRNNKIYTKIPSKFKSTTRNVAGGFHKLPSEIHLQEGFKPIITPFIDKPNVYKHNDSVFIEFDDRVEVSVEPIYPGITLEQAKEKRILELQRLADSHFKQSQWLYDREIRTTKIKDKETKPVTDQILEADNLIYSEYDRSELEINALTNIEDVLEYAITFNIIHNES